ncbi:MAG TPA: lipid kinase, partial [Clostridiaceae bacterium]|nr:lipid kinase [Clostridiaceae bacterium]
PVTIKQNDNIIKASIYLFVILNGSTAGGFKLAPGATARDGKLNLIAIKACSMVDLINFFIKMLKGEHLESNNVIYLTGDKFTIECDEKLDTDIDGEAGPTFPLDIGVERRRIKVFAP